MVKYSKGLLEVTDKGDKVYILKGSQGYHCNITVLPLKLPLPYGDGTYTVKILNLISGNRYKTIKTYSIKATNTSDYLLKFNLYVPRTDAANYAVNLCKDKDKLASYNAITAWVKKAIAFDYIKALTISKSKEILPAPQECWEKKRGICQDISSMIVGMLREVGVPSQLVIGRANNQAHAWVEAKINGKIYQFDFSKTGKQTVKYVAERYY